MLRLENKEFNNKLFKLLDVAKEVKKIIVAYKESSENRKNDIWGDVDIVSTLSNWNLSGKSSDLVGFCRLLYIMKILKEDNIKTKALWLIIDDRNTVKNEKNRHGGGGGEYFDFGIFGKYKCRKEINNAYPNVRKVIQDMRPGLNRGMVNNLTEILLGRMKGATQISPTIIQESLGINNGDIKYVRLTRFLESRGIPLKKWQKNKIEWLEEAGILHFGDNYQSTEDTKFHLPNGAASQAIHFWKDTDGRILDLNTLNLLYFNLNEYINGIRVRATEFEKDIEIKSINEIILKHLGIIKG